MTGGHDVTRVKYILYIASMRIMLQQHATLEDWCLFEAIKTIACNKVLITYTEMRFYWQMVFTS